MRSKKFLLIAFLLVFMSGIATYAIYRSSGRGIGNVSTAKWSIKISANDNSLSTTESNNISLENATWINPYGNVAEGKIAPGSYTTFNVKIDASETETSVDYAVVPGDLSSLPNIKVLPGASGIAGEGTIPYSDNPSDMIKIIPVTIIWEGSLYDDDEKNEEDLSFINQSMVIPISIVTAQKLPGNDIPDSDTMDYYLSTGGRARLVADVTLTKNSFAKNDLVLDLNGYTLNMGDNTLIPQDGLTITDTSSGEDGKITGTGDFVIQNGNSTNRGKLTIDGGVIEGNGAYGAIRNFGDLTINGGELKGESFVVYNDANSNLVMNGGTIESTEGSSVRLADDSNFEFNGGIIRVQEDNSGITLGAPGAKVVMNGGTIEAPYKEDNRGGLGILAFKDTEVIVNGGTIESSSFCLASNGSTSGNSEGSNAKFTINGGNFTSTDATTMYLPQPNGLTNINGGTFIGATNVIELRAGTLNITDGTFISTSSTYSSAANDSGTTLKGAAVGVAQHNTKLPINVNITGGTFTAKVPFAVENPNGNSDEDLAKIHLNIEKTSSKPLKFVSTGDTTVINILNTKFIKGGLYTHSVASFIPSGYKEINTDGMVEVVAE